MNSTTKKLLIFGGIVAVIIIIIALKKKQDEEMESGEGDAKLPSIGLVPATIVPVVQNEVPATPDAAPTGDQQPNTLLVEAEFREFQPGSRQPSIEKGSNYTDQYYDIRKGKNFFDGMKTC